MNEVGDRYLNTYLLPGMLVLVLVLKDALKDPFQVLVLVLEGLVLVLAVSPC